MGYFLRLKTTKRDISRKLRRIIVSGRNGYKQVCSVGRWHTYITIGIQRDLELFELSIDNKEIVFTHAQVIRSTIRAESRQPYNNEFLNKKISVTIASKNGSAPSKPFTSTIRDVFEQAIPD
jgi:hypothetical protein